MRILQEQKFVIPYSFALSSNKMPAGVKEVHCELK